MKTPTATTVILAVCLLTSGCRSQKQTDFPGFTKVAARTSTPYFINKNGVRRDSQPDGDIVSFLIIAPQRNSNYLMLQIATNCSTKLLRNGGTLYQADGKILSQIDADKRSSPLDTNSDIGKVALDACQAAMDKRAFSGDFGVQKAFTALFENYDPQSRSSSVLVKGDTGDESGKLTLLLDSPFSQGGARKHLLVTSTAVPGEDCHACGARIGAYVFANREGRWVPEIADKEAARFGAFGTTGPAQAVKFAPDVYGFSITLEDMHQGQGDTAQQFIAPVNNHYRQVLLLNTEEDNAGACGPDLSPCYQSKSTVRFLNSVHGLFDIEVDKSGTEYSNQGVTPADSHKLYVLVGDKYVEQGSASNARTE